MNKSPLLAISIIIPTHNRGDSLRTTLESLKNQTFPKDGYEIIVVDNASTDNTKGVTEECSLNGNKKLHYAYESRLGVHYARNSGARIAKGEILALADDDAIYDKNWLSCLYKHYGNPEVGCVGGKILAKWEADPPFWVNKIHASFFSLLDRGDQAKELNLPDDIYSANMSVRKNLLFEVKGFNPGVIGSIWLGDGETTLLRKISRAKYKIIYAPDALCWHFIPKERLTLTYIKRRARNGGVASSYAAYKKKKFKTPELLLRSCAFATYSSIHKLAAILKKIAGNDAFYEHECKSSYYRRRATYELRLSYSKTLREFVLKDDWLE